MRALWDALFGGLGDDIKGILRRRQRVRQYAKMYRHIELAIKAAPEDCSTKTNLVHHLWEFHRGNVHAMSMHPEFRELAAELKEGLDLSQTQPGEEKWH